MPKEKRTKRKPAPKPISESKPARKKEK